MEVDWSATTALKEINKTLENMPVQDAIENLDALVEELSIIREALVSDLQSLGKTEK